MDNLEYDPALGIFVWAIDKGPMKRGDRAGSFINGHYSIRIDGKYFPCRALAFKKLLGWAPDAAEVTYVNGVGRNLRANNLHYRGYTLADLTHSPTYHTELDSARDPLFQVALYETRGSNTRLVGRYPDEKTAYDQVQKRVDRLANLPKPITIEIEVDYLTGYLHVIQTIDGKTRSTPTETYREAVNMAAAILDDNARELGL